jgi:hypothetical protein
VTLNEHIFVRELPPLSLDDFCPDCLCVWESCDCDLPSFDEALETYEKETH